MNSTISGGINAMAGVTVIDVIQPVREKRTGNKLSKKISFIIFKVLGKVISSVIFFSIHHFAIFDSRWWTYIGLV